MTEEIKEPSKREQARGIIKILKEHLIQDIDMFYSHFESVYRYPKIMILVSIINLLLWASGIYFIVHGGNFMLGVGLIVFAFSPNALIYVLLKIKPFRKWFLKRKKPTPYYAVA